MKTTGMMAIGLVVSLVGTGCSTKKYVANTVAPFEQRVNSVEKKDTEQDKTIAMQGTQVEGMERDLSQTKEKLGDVIAKATQAGEAAKAADQRAVSAQQTAESARRAAEGAHTFAEQGLNRLDQTIDSMNKFQMARSASVLFGFNQDTLSDEAKTQLDALGNQAKGISRYVIEVQGFTDKSGPAIYNNILSERRAQAVARYLVNQYRIPVRAISTLGSGYAQPVADDQLRDSRKMNRRVEVRLWVPESASAKAKSNDGAQ
ncbi:MAG TPA: OmpA family protein [Bryobacteraceae bacterium]|nr:OmpA family protein [Bryobacteraceae bacterium]